MNYDYKILKPFKWFVLQNFPFIEADFDAITNWQLFCKLGEEINKLIASENLTGQQVEDLTNAFNDLTNYVNNYFANLDVQDEINNKLDEMAEAGTLSDIIAQYLNLASVLGYDTLNDLKNATNIVNGSIVRTLGKNTYNDGLGSFYKIRTVTSSDNVDEDNIVSLSVSNTLIAEKIQNRKRKILIIGDSYATGVTETSQVIDNFAKILCESYFNLSTNDYLIIAEGGAGFVAQTSSGKTFLNLLQENLPQNRLEFTDVIVSGGYNDYISTYSDILSARNLFMQYVIDNFPNARHYIAMIGNNSMDDTNGINIRTKLSNDVFNAYYDISNNDFVTMDGVECSLKHYNAYMSSDGIHPNLNGYQHIARNMYHFMMAGNVNIIEPKFISDIIAFEGYNLYANNNALFVKNNNVYFNFGVLRLEKQNGNFNFTNGMAIGMIHIPVFKKQNNNAIFNCTLKFTTSDGVFINSGYIEIGDNNEAMNLWSLSGDVNNATAIDIIIESKSLPLIYC